MAGFPNAFMMFGPNIGVASAFTLIEAQLRYVMDALRTMRREGLAAVEVRPEIQDAFNEEVQDALRGTVWNAGGCRSYYLDATGRNTTVWPWTMRRLQRMLRWFDLESYETEVPMPEPVAA